VELPSGLGANDQPQISLAYLPPTPRQTWSALGGAAVLLLGLAVLAPFAAKPLRQVNGFIPALDAIISVTDLITASLLLAHFSITRSRALLVLACGYLFSSLIVAAHGLSFPGAFSPTGNFGGSSQTTVRLYLFWHLGLPAALFAYVWLKDEERTKAGAHTPTALVALCSVAGVLALVSCIVWLSAVGDQLLPSALIDPAHSGPVVLWLIAFTMSICVATLFVLWVFQRSVLDQWLMVVVLASIVELAVTALFGGPRFTLGFYTGRVFSLVTSTVVLTALLAETTRLYARLARANLLASVVKASQALSSEIDSPKLVERLMTIAIENAGADQGLLILPVGDEFLIQAAARTTGGQIEVTMRHEPITPVTCPETLVRCVIRMRESVILDDASKSNPFFADDYLRDRQSKSILCLPLIKQRQMTGILLLENTLASHAFTTARIAVLELLAAQAAISLENTRLYGDLQDREKKVRRLVDSNIIGILIGNPDGHVQEANQAFLQIVGYDQADLAAGRLRRTELTPTEWHDRDEQALAEMRTTGTAQPFEKEYFRKDGSRVPVLVGGAALDERGDAVAIFAVDLTERKRAETDMRESERRFREVQMELAHANRVATMGELTASIAHEVGHPVGATLMNAEVAARWLARDPPELERARQSIDRIIQESKRAANIFIGIRDLVKKQPARTGDFAINEVILEVIALTHGETSKNRISVQTELAMDLPVVHGDRVQLQQVILNLILNAVEAMSQSDDGPRDILISTETELGRLQVAVHDSGPGLPQGGFEQVFKAFYTTKPAGLGMGLSICRSIVEAHGGRLWAAPNEPRGAVFFFTLPVEAKSLANKSGS
jgi:PAS domain S-box-containing protein